MKLYTEWKKALLEWIFPSFCLHCKNPNKEQNGPLCTSCFSLLELIDYEERCPSCFGSDFDLEKRFCYHCFVHPPIIYKTAAAFDYIGPASSLIAAMKYGNQPYLAEGLGAFMVMQLVNLNWPSIDLIVPIPLTFSHKVSRGFNQSLLLAESIGKIFNVPVKNILNRRLDDVSQAGLNRKQRHQLSKNSFYCAKNVDIMGLNVLLVDDVITTGKTLEAAAEVLYEKFPENIYAISACKAY